MKHFIHILACCLGIASIAGAQSIAPEEIRTAVRTAIEARLGEAAADATVEFRSEVRATPVASTAYHILVPALTNRPRGSFSVPVEIESDGTVMRHIVVSVRVRTFGFVLLAARQLGRNTVLRIDDVIAQRVETTTLPDDALSTPGDCEGRRTTKLVNAGSVLRFSSLEQIPVIRRGERLMLTLRTGNVVLRTEAVARDDGAIGSLISVQKLNSRERLRVRVVGPGTAEIQLN
jgi:flagellar basal body P-ring formation protein FlgA